MSKQYNCLPSEILGIEDDYTAFCFNEACMNIIIHLESGEKPRYIENKKNDYPNKIRVIDFISASLSFLVQFISFIVIKYNYCNLARL